RIEPTTNSNRLREYRTAVVAGKCSPRQSGANAMGFYIRPSVSARFGSLRDVSPGFFLIFSVGPERSVAGDAGGCDLSEDGRRARPRSRTALEEGSFECDRAAFRIKDDRVRLIDDGHRITPCPKRGCLEALDELVTRGIPARNGIEIIGQFPIRHLHGFQR